MTSHEDGVKQLWISLHHKKFCAMSYWNCVKVLYSIEDVVNGKYIGKHINKRLTSDDQRCSIDNYNINSNATFNLFEAT